MNKLLEINNKTIFDIDSTILCPSNFNYKEDIIEYFNNSCEVIINNKVTNLDNISNTILEDFNCTYLKTKDKLSKIDNIKINILESLEISKSIIVFIDILTYVDKAFKEKIIKYLKEKNKRIINYTTNIEETLLLDYLVVINNNKIVMEGLTKEVLKEDKILKKLGFHLPTVVELSIGLKYYGLVDDIFLNNEELVNYLWN